MSPRHESRGVSTTVNYVLLLGIVTMLVAVLLVGTANVVEGEQTRAVRSGMTVVAHDLAAELESTSALAASVGDAGSVHRVVDLPSDLSGAGYRVKITPVDPSDPNEREYVVTVWSTNPSETVTVSAVTAESITIHEATLDGGDVRIGYTSGGAVEVTNG